MPQKLLVDCRRRVVLQCVGGTLQCQQNCDSNSESQPKRSEVIKKVWGWLPTVPTYYLSFRKKYREAQSGQACGLLFILIIENDKSLEEKVVIDDYFPLAERSYSRSKSACCDNCQLLAVLLFYSVTDAVD